MTTTTQTPATKETTMNTTTATQPTKPARSKLIREWTGHITVGIYEDEPWSVKLYDTHATVRMPCVKWEGNSGSLDFARCRASAEQLAFLRKIHAEEEQDRACGEDDTELDGVLLERAYIAGCEL